MNRIDRLQAILTTIQSRRTITAEEIAKKFEISIRTVYRDIRALEEGGIPICAEAGIGYYIMKGYHLPPIMFTNDEARALVMAGKILEKNSDRNTSHNFQAALTKVRAVLKDDAKEQLEDLEDQIIVNPFTSSISSTEDSPVLSIIKSALVSRNTFTFDYYANTTGIFTQREIEPLGLCFYGGKWHIIGYCLLRNDYRDFRADRISNIKVTHKSYKHGNHPTLRQYLDKLTTGTDLKRVVVKVDESIHRFIANDKYFQGFVNEYKEGSYYVVEFATECMNYFARWLLMIGTDAEVLEPESLRTHMRHLLSEMSKKYID